jgi:hypothetical protein
MCLAILYASGACLRAHTLFGLSCRIFAHLTRNAQVLINCRNNHKLIARVKAFDRHCNMCVLFPVARCATRAFSLIQHVGSSSGVC